MIIEYKIGNLLSAEVDALVNTVNCVGIMGKGIALQFKQAFPENFTLYEKACKTHTIHPGHLLIYERQNYKKPRFIINFPTKTHWQSPSKIEYIKTGLEDLIKVINRYGIKSIAIPALGCGNGGLNWLDVKSLIEEILSTISSDVVVYIYSPQKSPAVNTMLVSSKKPKITLAQALIIKLIKLYSVPGYRLSLLEIQKLAYFLQETGEKSLKLKYIKHKYGPYANNLNYLLQKMEGHFIRGYGDRTSPSEIELYGNSVMEADKFLAEKPEIIDRLRLVQNLIEGYETPYGIELLATIHWLVKYENITLFEDILNAIANWNERKKEIMQAKHIQKGWAKLQHLQWI